MTPLGERVLREWMSVIKEERDCLGRVLRRYQATGTVDAVLAEVEGGGQATSDVDGRRSSRRPRRRTARARLDLDQLAPEADVFDARQRSQRR